MNTSSNRKWIKMGVMALAAFLLPVLFQSCGGGGGELPYVPQSMTRDCSGGPIAGRVAAQSSSASYGDMQCVQIHQYGEQIPVLLGTTLSVPSGGSLSLEAVAYDYACGDITTNFSGSYSWSLSSSALGSLSNSNEYASLTAVSTSSDVTGTINVAVYNGSTMVKEDTIDVVVKASNTPSAPTGLTATAGDAQVALSWTAPTTNTDSSAITDLAGYNVYYGTTSGGSYSQHNSTTVTGTTYTVTGLTNGTTYYFVVKAVDSENPVVSSADSSEASASPAVGASPTVTASVASTSLVLSSGSASTTLTCSYTGSPSTLQARCDTGDSWTSLTLPTNTHTCTWTAAGTYTPGCQVDGSISDDVDTAVTVSAAAATTFQQFYGDAGAAYEVGSAVIQTSDGGYLVGGIGSPAVHKADSTGTESWTYAFGGNAHALLQTGTDYIVCGDDGGGNAKVAKIDSSGTETWAQTYGANSISHCYGIIAVGSDFVFAGDNGSDAVLALISSTGTYSTSQTFDSAGNSNEFFKDVKQTTDLGYIAGGYTGDGSTNDDMWLVKTDSGFGQTWSQTYTNDVLDHAVGVYITSGGYALAGYTINGTYTAADCMLVLTDSSGTQTALQTYGDAGATDFCYGSTQTADGGFALTGGSQSTGTNGGEDFWLVRTDSSATMTWNQFHGTASNEWSNGVVETSDSGFAVIGSAPNGASNDFWLVKTDSAGLSP